MVSSDSFLLIGNQTDMKSVSAEVFDPDRFLDERTKYHTKNPFIFVPFNAGPRICLGQQVSGFFYLFIEVSS